MGKAEVAEPKWPASVMAMVQGLLLLNACGVVTEAEYTTIRKRIVDYDHERERGKTCRK